jgi:rhodanese-related sulfurtransferase
VLLARRAGAPADAAVNFITVDELKALLDRGTRADIIDVRHWDAYREMHIKDARSIRCGRRGRARGDLQDRASSSSTEPARTRWPGGPATSSTRSAGATTACSTKGCPAGTPRAIPSKAPMCRRSRVTNAPRRVR